MNYTNQLDRLPPELHMYIADILESDKRWHWENRKKPLEEIFKNHNDICKLGYQYKFHFMNISDFKFEQGLHIPNEEFYEIFELHKNKPVRFKRQTCFCIDHIELADIIIEFSSDWSMFDLFQYMDTTIGYVPDCDHHSFFEGYEVTDNGDDYIVEFVYGS